MLLEFVCDWSEKIEPIIDDYRTSINDVIEYDWPSMNGCLSHQFVTCHGNDEKAKYLWRNNDIYLPTQNTVN